MVTATEQSRNPTVSQVNGKGQPVTSSESSKVFTPILFVGELLLMIGIMLWGIIESIFRLIVPVAEKPVNEEIILITGTGHGMGKELALQYADLGATLVCVDINKENNDETVGLVNAKKTSKAYAYICDVSNYDAVKELAETVKKEVGTVTVLVNNAGIMPCQQFTSYTPQLIQKIFGINVFAHYWLTMAFLPGMIDKKRGHIISTSSMAGLFGMPNLVPYCGSKFAVRGMMDALKEELRLKLKDTNIRTTTIYPHMVNTGLCQKPQIRFPALFGLLDAKNAAKCIISAHRRNVIEEAIPSHFLLMNLMLKLLPYKSLYAFNDFVGLGLDEHDN